MSALTTPIQHHASSFIEAKERSCHRSKGKNKIAYLQITNLQNKLLEQVSLARSYDTSSKQKTNCTTSIC